MQKESNEWNLTTLLFKGLALIVPWGIVENCLVVSHHPEIGYVAGLWVGILCIYAVSPRDIALWKYAVLGLTMSVVHPVINLLFNHR